MTVKACAKFSVQIQVTISHCKIPTHYPSKSPLFYSGCMHDQAVAKLAKIAVGMIIRCDVDVELGYAYFE